MLPLADKELQFSLEPLKPWKDKLTIVQGLSGGSAAVATRTTSSAAPGGFRRWPRRWGREPSGASARRSSGALAKAIPGTFPHIGLGMSKRLESSVIYNVSAWERDRPLPTMCRPDQSLRHAFRQRGQRSGQGGIRGQEQPARFSSAGDIRKVESQLVTARTRERFSALPANAFETLRNRQSRLNEIEHTLRAKGPVPSDKYKSAVETDRLNANTISAAAALICGLTNVLRAVVRRRHPRL
jgi:hypothetical protein